MVEALGTGSVYSPVRCPTCKHTLKPERHSFLLKAVRRWSTQQMKRASVCQVCVLECGLFLCACLTDTFEEQQVITAFPRSRRRRRHFPPKTVILMSTSGRRAGLSKERAAGCGWVWCLCEYNTVQREDAAGRSLLGPFYTNMALSQSAEMFSHFLPCFYTKLSANG